MLTRFDRAGENELDSISDATSCNTTLINVHKLFTIDFTKVYLYSPQIIICYRMQTN